MKKNQSVTPHDDFFKLLMEAKKNASEIIRTGLPGNITQKLNLNSLKQLDSSFTNGKRGNFRADVVYECEYAGDTSVTITLLFEHKSYREKQIFLQLLRYMLGIWERERKNGQALRPIIPIVFFHGQREWQYRHFEEYFDRGEIPAELLPFTPKFDFVFYNLQQKPDSAIVAEINDPGLKMALLAMKHVRSPRLLEQLEEIFLEAQELKKTPEGRTEFAEIYLYLILSSQELKEKIEEVMERRTMFNHIPEGSIVWQMMQILKDKALVESKSEIALAMLKDGFDIEKVVELTRLDLEVIEKLQAEIS